jgi:DNA-directed RNA polymerase subunit RPC12/RpoP
VGSQICRGAAEIMKSNQEEGIQSVQVHEPSQWRRTGAPKTGRERAPAIPVGISDAPPLSELATREESPRNSEFVESALPMRIKGGRLVSELTQIRAVAFCCSECHTVVSLPRIRWANSPETCPNCGARWMSKPSPDGSLPDDDPTYVYRVVSAFRDALQRLIGVKQTAVFDFFLEIGESSNQTRPGSAETRRKGKVHA